MSFADGGAGPGSATPSWATRANEPLVPAVHIPTLKKAVARDLKEIQKASEEISKLRKRGSRDVGSRLVALSAQTRERARELSRAQAATTPPAAVAPAAPPAPWSFQARQKLSNDVSCLPRAPGRFPDS